MSTNMEKFGSISINSNDVTLSNSGSNGTDNKSSFNQKSSFSRNQEVTRGELIYLLGSVKTSMSSRSSEFMISLFPSICPDSSIAKNLSLGRTKYSYFLCYGLAPYFENQLVKKLAAADEYVAMFDESLNKISQKCQMDILVRFFDKDTKAIATHYLDSAFLGRTRAIDILEEFCRLLKNIGLKKLISVSMDGPNTNWLFLTELCKLRDEQQQPELILVGSCGLHILHGATKDGMKAMNWTIRQTLSCGYYLFKDSPKRRSDYFSITSCSIYPLKFCSIRWLDNVRVAQRFLELIPNLKQYCDYVDPKPDNQSFRTIQAALSDPLLKAKLCFFISVCSVIEPFLRRFQSAKPLFPFLYGELSEMQSTLAKRYLKSSVIEKASTTKQLANAISLARKEDLLPIPDVGIATKIELDKFKVSGNPSHARLTLEFYAECKHFLSAMCKKIAERSPVKYDAVKYVCLNILLIL
jgi:hypothetical protein